MDLENLTNTSLQSSKEDLASRTPVLLRNTLDYTSILIRQELTDVLMNSSSINCSNFLENPPLNITYSDHLLKILCSQPGSFDAIRSGAYQLNEQAIFLLAIYSVILLLSVTGNLLVLVTLLQHRRMRTPTNILLLNLSASDLLLIVVCVPFTLTGSLLRDFIFGRLACHVIPYLQAVSVSVSSWTLVTISHERYSGICQPFKSRGWRTAGHARKKIAWVWILSLTFMLPIAFISTLKPIGNTGRHKCREHWPSSFLEKLYSISLMIFLLLIPLLLMILAYMAIRKVLNQSISNDRQNSVKFPRNVAISSTVSRRNDCQMSKWSTSSFKSGCHSSVTEESVLKDNQDLPAREYTKKNSHVFRFMHEYKWTSTEDKNSRTLTTIQEVENCPQTKDFQSETSFRKSERNISNADDLEFFRTPERSNDTTQSGCDHNELHNCEENSAENLAVDEGICPDDDAGISVSLSECMRSSSSPVTFKKINRENVRALKFSIQNEDEDEIFNKNERVKIDSDEEACTAPSNFNYFTSSSKRSTWGKPYRQAFELKCNSVLTIDEQNKQRPSVNLDRGLVTFSETKKHEGHKKWKFSRKLSLAASKTRTETPHGSKKGGNSLRSTTSLKALKEKQRMIKMIGVVVLEFFVCWTPLYVVNTVALYDLSFVYEFLGMKGVSAVQLLAYCSACCNPITYCFMSKNFRSAFLNVIRCRKSSLARC
ncbi:G protein-coupled receptor rhodopsin-like [Trinorchestia longiramus]|nr:G protein-coupled receptor rhodopsin-like [Trinorchestia longiramus]